MRKLQELLAEVRPDVDFTETHVLEGVLDSFDLLFLVNRLEETYGIEIPNNLISLENFRNTDDVAALVARISKKEYSDD